MSHKIIFIISTGSQIPIPPKQAGKENRCCSDSEIGQPKSNGQNLFINHINGEMRCHSLVVLFANRTIHIAKSLREQHNALVEILHQ